MGEADWYVLYNVQKSYGAGPGTYCMGSVTVGEAEHYAKVTVELLHLYVCNTLTFTRYNETSFNKLHWSQ